MDTTNTSGNSLAAQEHFHFGHIGIIAVTAVLLLGASWMKNPELFNLKKTSVAADENTPKYYAYVQPTGDAYPMVAGASTVAGPSVINEDGSISPVGDTGAVLGASTEDVALNLDAINVTAQADTEQNIKNYFSESSKIEAGYLDTSTIEAAITSNNQEQLNAQAEKISAITLKLQKLAVPSSLVKLHKLKILQYNAGATLLKNYSNADSNPEMVSQALGVFLTTQQQLEQETGILKQKYNLNDTQN